jgi:hypothetical protein
MTTPGRVGAGAALGILAASLAMPAVGFFKRPGEWGLGPEFYLAAMPLVLLFTAILAGPGAFLLSWVHAVRMESWAPKARSFGHLRRVGVLLGLPLGVANLALVFGALGFLGVRNHISILILAPWLIPALAGGAGLGWGVTIGLTPGRAAPARTTARPRPTRKLRRDGPPFFDTRVSRNPWRAA